jgi:hypothetical protein
MDFELQALRESSVFVPCACCRRKHWKPDVDHPPAECSNIAVCDACWQTICERMHFTGQSLTDAFWDVYIERQYVVSS